MSRIMSSVLILVLVLSSPLGAKGKDDSTTKALKKIAELGPGVYKVKYDKKGRITTCVVVSSSRISTVLGKTKGLQVAQKRAALAVRGEFVKWLNEDVSIHENSVDETTLFLESNSDNDTNAIKESGKSLEKTTTTINSVAKGCVRRLQLLHREVNGEDKLLTLVYGWTSETAAAANRINEEKKRRREKRQKGKKGGSGTRKIKSKITTSDAAKKFID